MLFLFRLKIFGTTKVLNSPLHEKSMLQEYVNKRYLDQKTIMALCSRFRHQRPFPHAALKDFFVETFVRGVAKALREQEFQHQESDLFSFSQTKDLSLLADPQLASFYRLLQSWEFKDYLHQLTGVEAFGGVDCSGFLYQQKDYLLPHDDHLETRRIAYTFHLSRPDFSRRDGGALEFFDGKKIVTSYPPHFNSFIFFPVLEGKTLHHVSEVLTGCSRYSLSGWFHDH